MDMPIANCTIEDYRDCGLIKVLGTPVVYFDDSNIANVWLDAAKVTMTVKIDKAADTNSVRSALREILDNSEDTCLEHYNCGCRIYCYLKVKRTKSNEVFVTYVSMKNL